MTAMKVEHFSHREQAVVYCDLLVGCYLLSQQRRDQRGATCVLWAQEKGQLLILCDPIIESVEVGMTQIVHICIAAILCITENNSV